MTDLLDKQRRLLVFGGAEPPLDPLTLSPIAWYDAPSLALTNDARVTTWTDLSGAGNDLAQSNASWKPQYKTGVQNSLAVLRFDGTTYHMVRSSLTGGDLSQPGVVAVVAKMTVGGSGTKHMVDGNGATERWAIGMSDSATAGNRRWVMNDGANQAAADSTKTDGAWYVMLHRVNGASSKLFVGGGTALVAADAGAHVLGGINVGANAGLGAVWGGDIGEILVCGDITVAQQNALGKYLAGRWGLTWTNVA